MAHPTTYGLSQECGTLIISVQPLLPRLEKRKVTQALLDKYGAKNKSLGDAVVAATSTTSDKEQLTGSEHTARVDLIHGINKVQGAAKRVFGPGSPQRKEFFIGEKHNFSTAKLVEWANGIASAWKKYSTILLADTPLVQEDIDSIVAAAALLGSTNSTQEKARHFDMPEANRLVQDAMADVIATADYIYQAVRAEYTDDPKVIGEFEAIKPLRYSVQRKPKDPPPPPPSGTSNS